MDSHFNSVPTSSNGFWNAWLNIVGFNIILPYSCKLFKPLFISLYMKDSLTLNSTYLLLNIKARKLGILGLQLFKFKSKQPFINVIRRKICFNIFFNQHFTTIYIKRIWNLSHTYNNAPTLKGFSTWKHNKNSNYLS